MGFTCCYFEDCRNKLRFLAFFVDDLSNFVEVSNVGLLCYSVNEAFVIGIRILQEKDVYLLSL